MDALSTMLDSMISPRWDPSELSRFMTVLHDTARLEQHEKEYGIIVAEISLVDNMVSNWVCLAKNADSSTLLLQLPLLRLAC